MWEEFIPEVAQAQGMVSVQASCTVAEALTMMHERAQIEHQTLHQVADAVVARSIRFGL
ncbi:MAG: ANTAR domain-containing protein [Acidimicrobiia bacterium]